MNSSRLWKKLSARLHNVKVNHSSHKHSVRLETAERKRGESEKMLFAQTICKFFIHNIMIHLIYRQVLVLRMTIRLA